MGNKIIGPYWACRGWAHFRGYFKLSHYRALRQSQGRPTFCCAEADAKSRTENLALHRQIEVERADVNQQRDALEQERRQIAAERNRDPIIAESIQLAAGLIAAVLPLLVCLYLLRGLFDKPDQDALAELLVEDLVSRQPLLGNSAPLNLPETGGNPRLPAGPPAEERPTD